MTGNWKVPWRRPGQGPLAQDDQPPENRAKLMDLYRDDNLRTQDLIGRDLPCWLEPAGGERSSGL